jgi:hypothetical protein
LNENKFGEVDLELMSQEAANILQREKLIPIEL